MPLYIKDDSVDDLAIKFQVASGAKNKTAAVKTALLESLAALKSKQPLMERMAELQERADKLGDADPDFDEKRFMDDMWDET